MFDHSEELNVPTRSRGLIARASPAQARFPAFRDRGPDRLLPFPFAEDWD